MTRTRLAVGLLVTLTLVTPATAHGQSTAAGAENQPAPPPSCEQNEHARQLDFWLGHWHVFHPETGEKQGDNRIESLLGGCLLLENWTGARGMRGKSMNTYDRGRGTWRQLWVADNGNVLDYTAGELRDGAMHFSGVSFSPEGDSVLQRLIFEPVAPDTVRQTFRSSTDGGSTWETTWVGIYVRQTPDPGT